jgi:hypothetical protein
MGKTVYSGLKRTVFFRVRHKIEGASTIFPDPQLPQLPGFFLDFNQGHLEMGPSRLVAKP